MSLGPEGIHWTKGRESVADLLLGPSSEIEARSERTR